MSTAFEPFNMDHFKKSPCWISAARTIRGYLRDSSRDDLLDVVSGQAVQCARATAFAPSNILEALTDFAGITEAELASKGEAGRESRRSLITREMEHARARASALASFAEEPGSVGDDSEWIGSLHCEDSLSSLTRPPGLVGELIDWIEAAAEYPSRELALGAALGWVATLAGRGFQTQSRARTNLYMVALAPSGYGKDHAGSCIMSLAQQTGLDRFIGPARFMSASALRESLIEQPSLLAIQDEFGGIIRQIDGPKVGIHNEMIRVDLLALFSRAKDLYPGAAYAAVRAVKLYNPNLSIYGMSTPEDFWSALSSSRTVDGFLPRFLLFNIEGSKPKRVTPRLSSGKAPQRLIENSREVYQAVYGGGNLAGKLDGTFAQDARTVEMSPCGQAALARLETRIENVEAQLDSQQTPILNRTREHALKLALTIAIGVKPTAPLIDHEAMEWGARLAWLSTCSLAREIEHRVADNDRQREFQKIMEIIRSTGTDGITRSSLLRKLGAKIDVA